MDDFWAVIGRTCLDEDFHRELFNRAIPDAAFEDLTELGDYLRRDQGLRLGRWDVMNVNRILTKEFISLEQVAIQSFEDDSSIPPIRAGLGRIVLDFSGRFELCAAFGLVCVDRGFREQLHDASDGGSPPDLTRLAALLTRPSGDTPVFEVGSDDVELLNSLIRNKIAEITTFHERNWVQPTEPPIACDSGYTRTGVYVHFSQPEMILLALQNPDLVERLQGGRGLQGSTSAFR